MNLDIRNGLTSPEKGIMRATTMPEDSLILLRIIFFAIDS